ncbi:copper resistance CopC family protein, partial [Mycobacterium kyorinense]|uniref:copper resistance CopC family protein n=1 Tax=Mycobacterium kyorinense TaxID=487514 RepID=UPI000AF1DBC0
MTRPARSAAAVALLVVIAFTALGTAGVASAHAVRVATDPAENAALSAGPSRVSATFNERLQPAFAAMNVLGPDGRLWSTGEPQVEGAVVSIGVRPLG